MNGRQTPRPTPRRSSDVWPLPAVPVRLIRISPRLPPAPPGGAARRDLSCTIGGIAVVAKHRSTTGQAKVVAFTVVYVRKSAAATGRPVSRTPPLSRWERGRWSGPLLHHPVHQGAAGAAEKTFPKAFAGNTLHRPSTCCTRCKDTKGRCRKRRRQAQRNANYH